MGDRVILHSDINCCYASIEHLNHPELAGKPLAVGGDPEARHGIVLTADYIAKKYGVKTGMALWQAKQVCPDITFVSPRMDLYLRFSRMAHEIYAEYTDRQEPYGIDECWLDVTGSSSLKGDGLLIAQEISRRMKSELGITVSVGVSFNKIFAKLGSDYKKPDAITTMYKSEFKQKAWSLPVADLLYVGKSTNRKLALFGIKTIGDLARTDEDVLNSHLGKIGSILWSFANGYDHNGSQNMHIHMVINSVRKYVGKQSRWHDKPCEWKQGCKHKSTGKMMFHAKKWVMEKCIRLGVGQVDLLAKKHTDNYWVEKRMMNQNAKDGVGVTSNRELIRDTIDKLLPFMDSFEQLVECLQFMYNWKIRVTNKTVTFSTPDMKQGIRGNKLGEGYGKAELVARIAKVVAERNAEKEARRIEEEKARQKAEVLAIEEAARKARQLQEERKQRELLAWKRKLVFDRNRICQDYCSEELAREDWNKDYVAYLQSQFINANDAAEFVEGELTAPVMTKEEFERQQAVELYKEKAARAGGLWDDALKGVSSDIHKWKWEYMDYLEDVKYRDIADVTLEEAKEEIMSYEEFAELKDAEEKFAEENQVQTLEMVAIPGNATDEAQIIELLEDAEPEIVEMEEVISEVVADVAEIIDYTKLSIEERAALLQIPTDDYEAEYDAYCQRMGYTADKMKSIRYKMTVYDEFLEEYQYRKKYCGVRDDSRRAAVSEKNRGAR